MLTFHNGFMIVARRELLGEVPVLFSAVSKVNSTLVNLIYIFSNIVTE